MTQGKLIHSYDPGHEKQNRIQFFLHKYLDAPSIRSLAPRLAVRVIPGCLVQMSRGSRRRHRLVGVDGILNNLEALCRILSFVFGKWNMHGGLSCRARSCSSRSHLKTWRRLGRILSSIRFVHGKPSVHTTPSIYAPGLLMFLSFSRIEY